MIQKITVTNHLDESMTMELGFPEKSGFLIRSIEGLGPTKADIATTEMSAMDGAIYNSARAQARNVVLSLTFLEFPTIETTRQLSYKYFPLKKRVKLEIVSDNRSVYVYGYVESNEPDIFSKQEGTTISLICPDAYLYDINDAETVFSTVLSNFQFPFSNESLTNPLIEFSILDLQTIKTVLYEGDATIGLIIHIHATGSASDVEIINTRTLESISINSAKLIVLTGSDISEGDDIYISTVKGDKYALLYRNGTPTNILNVLGQDPDWFTLEKGDNIFAYTANSGLVNLQFSITNKVAYEGA